MFHGGVHPRTETDLFPPFFKGNQLGREVALKVLPKRLAESAEAFDRLEREANVLASLNHPNRRGLKVES